MSSARELTDREREALAAFRALAADGAVPTITAVGEAMRLPSPNNAVRYLDALAAAGELRKVGGGSRRYRLPDEGRGLVLPFRGLVAAGPPVEMLEPVEERVSLSARLDRPGYFLLRVRGTSMVGALIGDRDYVVVKPMAEVEPGELVVYRVGAGYTLKRYRKKGRRVWLEPANPAAPDIELGPGDEAVGAVAAVVRFGSP